jgi:hypothetical protein
MVVCMAQCLEYECACSTDGCSERDVLEEVGMNAVLLLYAAERCIRQRIVAEYTAVDGCSCAGTHHIARERRKRRRSE